MYTLKKSLGQHFLIDENVCKKIVAEVQKRPFNRLLEVGPGAGALTKYFLQINNIDFRAVELDQEKVTYLLHLFPLLENKIIKGDFLEIKKPFNESFTIVGNFPYNISTQILFKILDWKEQVDGVVGMFQKEVAQRIAAREGNKIYGVTSVLVQAFFKVEYLFDVHEKCFQPPPKVKSGVLRLIPDRGAYSIRSEKDLFLLVKTAFNQRRKMLRNAVRGLFDTDILSAALFDKRAEHLSVQQYADLTFRMK